MSEKTNAIRLIQQAKLVYRDVFYDFNENDSLGLHTAQAVGLPAEQVFKTLVARGDRTGIQVFCIPACCELDLKKAAKASGNKKVEMVAVKELPGLTGYVRGGCSPIGMKKHYPTYIDETCILWDEISVSAGARGHLIILKPDQLVSFINGIMVDLT